MIGRPKASDGFVLPCGAFRSGEVRGRADGWDSLRVLYIPVVDGDIDGWMQSGAAWFEMMMSRKPGTAIPKYNANRCEDKSIIYREFDFARTAARYVPT